MEPPAKKPKIYHYHNEWEKLYLCVKLGSQASCLLCGQVFKYTKASNIKRHYESQHAKFEEKYPLKSRARIIRINAMKKKLGVDTSAAPLCNDTSTTGNLISYRVAYLLAKQRKPLADGETFKELFPTVIKDMFMNTELERRVNNFADNLALSRPTITQRIGTIAQNLQSQLFADISRCDFFSMQLNESTDTPSQTQTLVFFRLVFSDLSVREELFTIFSSKKNAKSTEIFDSLKTVLSSAKVPLEKLAAITTNGATNMIDSENGLIAECRKDPDFPKFNSFHCALHQLALCCKDIKFEGILDLVMNIVSSILSKPIQDHMYNLFVDEKQSTSRGLTYYTDVRWLKKSNMLVKFYDNLIDIKEFLTVRGQEYPQLDDREWLNKFAYMVDLTEHLNYYNKKMQGNLKSYMQVAKNIQSLKLILQNAVKGFQKNLVPFEFSRLRNIVNDAELKAFDAQYFADSTQKIYENMEKRFIDINETYQILNFLLFPNGNHDIYSIMPLIIAHHPINTIQLSREIPDFQNDARLTAILSAGGDIWAKIAEEDMYPNLLIVYKRIASFCTDTYLCDMGFSHINHIKSSERSLLTSDNLLETMLIALSNYKPPLETLAENTNSQSSS